MQDQLAFDQLLQAVVDHPGEFLLEHRIRLAGIVAPQGANRRRDKFLHLLARDGRVVDDGQDAVHEVRLRVEARAGAERQNQNQNETENFHQLLRSLATTARPVKRPALRRFPISAQFRDGSDKYINPAKIPATTSATMSDDT